MAKISNVTGVILSGGKSSRMGENKSLLVIDDVPLIKITYDLLSSLFEEVLISTNEPELYKFLESRMIEDRYKNLGPLAGIYSSLSAASNDKIFVVSADMPFITKSVIEFMLNVKSDLPIVLPKAENRIQYICGIYDKEILPVAKHVLSTAEEAKQLYNGKKDFNLSIKSFVERVGAEIVDVDYEKFHFKDLFFNINTHEDFEYAKAKIIF